MTVGVGVLLCPDGRLSGELCGAGRFWAQGRLGPRPANDGQSPQPSVTVNWTVAELAPLLAGRRITNDVCSVLNGRLNVKSPGVPVWLAASSRPPPVVVLKRIERSALFPGPVPLAVTVTLTWPGPFSAVLTVTGGRGVQA